MQNWSLDLDNLTGFIVKVKAKCGVGASFKYNNDLRLLAVDEVFIGYFWQATRSENGGPFNEAHIKEVHIRDEKRKTFSYGGQAVFSTDDVLIEIFALRGPDSNNRGLPEKFQNYETWYLDNR